MSAQAAVISAIVLDGPVLRCAQTDRVLCQLDLATGRWTTPDGAATTALALPAQLPQPLVTDTEQVRARRERDARWLQASLPIVKRLAMARATLTSDDVWAALEQPPAEARQIGQLLKAAVQWIEPTDEHQPSKRPINHGRPVRVWRSLLAAGPPQQTLLSDSGASA